jgi:PTH1 family peptidyl-tRNA hydrolase
MWIIAGLGNPGSRYEGTPHNLGFDVVRILAARHGLRYSASRTVRAEEATGFIGPEKVALLMPTTYMNLSGEAVVAYANYYKVEPENVLAITDDVNLPWGKIRVRPGGSHGGHNGLRNIIQHFGHDRFPRVRIGCEPEGWPGDLVAYVLAKLVKDARELADHMTQVTADTVEYILKNGVKSAQNEYNGYDACKDE